MKNTTGSCHLLDNSIVNAAICFKLKTQANSVIFPTEHFTTSYKTGNIIRI